MNKLTLSLAQMDVVPGEPEANLAAANAGVEFVVSNPSLLRDLFVGF